MNDWQVKTESSSDQQGAWQCRSLLSSMDSKTFICCSSHLDHHCFPSMRAQSGMQSSELDELEGSHRGTQSACGPFSYSSVPLVQRSRTRWSGKTSNPAKANTKTQNRLHQDLRYWYTILHCITPSKLDDSPRPFHNPARRTTAWRSAISERRQQNKRLVKCRTNKSCSSGLR